METNVVNSSLSAVMAQNRKVAQKYGPYFGQMLFTIVATNPDMKWKEDCIAGRQTLRNEVKAFVIKAIDVKSVELMEKDVDGYPKIIINKADNDPNLVFPVVEPEFTKATRENVSECIDRASKPGSKPMFFSAAELGMLTDLVRVANQGALNTYEEQARKMMKLAETVRGMMDATDRLKADYLRQCGIDNDTTEVHVRVEVTE